MAVYVDDVRHPFGRMIMCHMWADTDNELLSMADKIGVQRKWIQGHPTLSFGKHRNASWVHFDVSLGAKTKAIAAGAILMDKYGPAEHMAKIRMRNSDPSIASSGKEMLERIANIRRELVNE